MYICIWHTSDFDVVEEVADRHSIIAQPDKGIYLSQALPCSLEKHNLKIS
jgi:hypothetical protein